MPITRVELNADRLRYRRDNTQLRASKRETRVQNGDTLANASAETSLSPAPDQDVVEPGPDGPAPARSRLATTRPEIIADSRLCDLKAIISSVPKPVESEQHAVANLPPNIPPNSATHAPQTTQPTESPGNESTTHEGLDPKVGQSRLDLITGEWTWFATMRSQRPDQFGNVVVKPAPEIDCPFCGGEEERTPDPVWIGRIDGDDTAAVMREHDSNGLNSGSDSDWAVRVVPNLYPAVTRLEDADVQTPVSRSVSGHAAETEPMPDSARAHRSGNSFAQFQHAAAIDHDHRALRNSLSCAAMFPCEPAMGGHEVIIESPRHTESFGELNTAEISLVFAAYAARIRYWRSVPGVRHVAIFKNVGRDAGASLQHSHSQLIATHRVPALVQQVTRRLQAHHARVGSCLQCDLLRGEIEQKSRLVSQTDSFVAYCPFASRFPLQVRLTSKEHLTCFSNLRPYPLNELARLTLRVVRWLEALRPSTAYNVLIHTCPNDFQGADDSQHWAMDIFPRLSRLAGFELATGAMINPIYPETAAKAYRAQARAGDPRYVLR